MTSAERNDGNNCLFVFPEEIWELILEALDINKDIDNTINALPELFHLRHGKQFSWQLGHVLPLIFPKLISFNDLKAFRLVSRRWRDAADICLETHPDERPDENCGAPVMLTRTHFCYSVLPDITTNFELFQNLCKLGSMIKDWNPFPGRVVSVVIRPTVGAAEALKILNSATFHMKRFGHHVRCIIIQILPRAPFIENLSTPIFQCLSHLPNLKFLRLSRFQHFDFAIKEVEPRQGDKDIKTCFPFQLESLNLCSIDANASPNKELCRSLMKAFAQDGHLKRLVIDAASWSKQYAPLLTRLGELCVQIDEEGDLKRILKDLKSSPIRKLFIWSTRINAFNAQRLIGILHPYNIESLMLADGMKFEDTDPQPAITTSASFRKYVSTIRSRVTSGRVLSARNLTFMATPQHCLKFLSSLPSLEYLTILIFGFDWELTEETFIEIDPKDIFRTCLHNFYYGAQRGSNEFKHIWKDLPNLKMLTIREYQTDDDDDEIESLTETAYQFVVENKDKVYTTVRKCVSSY